MVDINRVLADVKIANCRTTEAGIEHERVLPAASENVNAIADVVECVILRRAAYDLKS